MPFRAGRTNTNYDLLNAPQPDKFARNYVNIFKLQWTSNLTCDLCQNTSKKMDVWNWTGMHELAGETVRRYAGSAIGLHFCGTTIFCNFRYFFIRVEWHMTRFIWNMPIWAFTKELAAEYSCALHTSINGPQLLAGTGTIACLKSKLTCLERQQHQIIFPWWLNALFTWGITGLP